MSDENNNDDAMDAWNEALTEQAESTGENDADKKPLDDLVDNSQPVSDEHPSIDLIMEIPVSISMEVGKTNITIRNLLKLNQGSVVELDRFAGDPLDVYVNNNLIAHGEVVVVNEKFGIRLTDIVNSAERINKLGE